MKEMTPEESLRDWQANRKRNVKASEIPPDAMFNALEEQKHKTWPRLLDEAHDLCRKHKTPLVWQTVRHALSMTELQENIWHWCAVAHCHQCRLRRL